MIAFLIGILLIAFAIYAVLPVSWSPNWWQSVVEFLKGGIPILALLIGLLALLIGLADIKDRREAKREEEKEKAENSEQTKKD
jgi:hypothetical protein